jgi:hypothetical protein
LFPRPDIPYGLDPGCANRYTPPSDGGFSPDRHLLVSAPDFPKASEEARRAVNGTPEEKVDLEQLKAAIRARAARKRTEIAAAVPLAVKARGGWTFNWLEAKTLLKTAARYAEAGQPPTHDNRHGLKRWVVELISRTVLRLTRFITTRQTDYNVSMLDTVRDMAEALHDVETRVVQQQEQIRQLEAVVCQLQFRAAPSTPERKAS